MRVVVEMSVADLNIGDDVRDIGLGGRGDIEHQVSAIGECCDGEGLLRGRDRPAGGRG